MLSLLCGSSSAKGEGGGGRSLRKDGFSSDSAQRQQSLVRVPASCVLLAHHSNPSDGGTVSGAELLSGMVQAEVLPGAKAKDQKQEMARYQLLAGGQGHT